MIRDTQVDEAKTKQKSNEKEVVKKQLNYILGAYRAFWIISP